MKITLLSDNQDRWFEPFLDELERSLADRGHEVVLCRLVQELGSGDLAFFLSCTSMVPAEKLEGHTLNLVVHESALPEGRGYSPVQWQVEAGSNRIPVRLVEATARVDAGRIFLQDDMQLEGHELLGEIRDIQGRKTVEIVLKFVDRWPEVHGVSQEGDGSTFPRRTLADNELDPQKTLAAQFDRLRLGHNEIYRSWFRFRGCRYSLKIEKEPDA